MSRNRSPIVFLDKDGTLVEDIPYNSDPDLIRLEPGVLQALKMLQDAGFRLVVVSNQSGIARGIFPETALKDVRTRLENLLFAGNVTLDGFYYCPHHPQGIIPKYAIDCECRKPKPGLLLQAAVEMEADRSQCWMIGDILNDVEAGNRAGCRTILLDNGHETEWIRSPLREPDFTVKTILDAAKVILNKVEPLQVESRNKVKDMAQDE